MDISGKSESYDTHFNLLALYSVFNNSNTSTFCGSDPAILCFVSCWSLMLYDRDGFTRDLWPSLFFLQCYL